MYYSEISTRDQPADSTVEDIFRCQHNPIACVKRPKIEGGGMVRFGVPELLIILVIILLLFGVGRLGKIAGELGKGIRAFRDGLSGEADSSENDTKEAE